MFLEYHCEKVSHNYLLNVFLKEMNNPFLNLLIQKGKQMSIFSEIGKEDSEGNKISSGNASYVPGILHVLSYFLFKWKILMPSIV